MPCPLDPIEIMLNVRGEKIQKKYLPSNLFNFVLSFTTGKKGSYLKKTRRILLKKNRLFLYKKRFQKCTTQVSYSENVRAPVICEGETREHIDSLRVLNNLKRKWEKNKFTCISVLALGWCSPLGFNQNLINTDVVNLFRFFFHLSRCCWLFNHVFFLSNHWARRQIEK